MAKNKIKLWIANSGVKYELQQPLVQGDSSIYECLIDKESIDNWAEQGTAETNRKIYVCFSNIKNFHNNVFRSVEIALGQAEQDPTTNKVYYICDLPTGVLSEEGWLYVGFCTTWEVSEQGGGVLRKKFTTDDSITAMQVNKATSFNTSISITDNTWLMDMQDALSGGTGNQVLTKNSDAQWDISWKDPLTNVTADRLQNARQINMDGVVKGNVAFDGSQDVTFENLKFDFSALEKDITFTGTIPASALPDEVVGQMIYGGAIECGRTSAQIWLTARAKNYLNTTSDTIVLDGNSNITTPAGLINESLEGLYFICSTNIDGEVPAISISQNAKINVGDWLLVVNNTWVKIDNTDAVVSVNNKTGAVNLSYSDVGAAPASTDNPLVAQSAAQLATARLVNGVEFSGTKDITNFVSCSTPGATSEKIVDLTGFNKLPGSILYVRFTNANTANEITLNVNETGPAPVKIRGYQIGTQNMPAATLQAGCIYTMVYDGGAYIVATGANSAATTPALYRDEPDINIDTNSVAVTTDIKASLTHGAQLLVYRDGVLLAQDAYNLSSDFNTVNGFNPALTGTSQIQLMTIVAEDLDSSSALPIPQTISDLVDNTESNPIAKTQYAISAGTAENATQASKLVTARAISLTGAVNGSVDFDGTADASIVTSLTDDRVKKSGDSMTGALTLSGAPTSNLHAVTKEYVDDNMSIKANNKALNNEDLNTIIIPGFYNAPGGNTVTNKPLNVPHFGLEVIHDASGSYYTQIMHTDNTTYRRKCVNGAWTSWTEDKYTDTMVTQTNTSANATYRLLLSASENNTDETNTIFKSGNFKANPNTGRLVAPTFVGALEGTASTASTATKLTTPRTITLTGAVTGEATNVDWSQDVTINTTGTAGIVKTKVVSVDLPYKDNNTIQSNGWGSAHYWVPPVFNNSAFYSKSFSWGPSDFGFNDSEADYLISYQCIINSNYSNIHRSPHQRRMYIHQVYELDQFRVVIEIDSNSPPSMPSGYKLTVIGRCYKLSN